MNKKIIIGIVIIALVLVAGYFLGEIEEEIYTAQQAEEISEQWVEEESPTYVERGGDALSHQSTEEVEEATFEVIFDFEASFAGYGEVGEDEMAAQVITPHTIVVTVSSNEVVSAITDDVFDEMTGEMIDDEDQDEDEDEDEDDEDLITVDLFFVEVVDGMEDLVAVSREVELVNGVEESTLVALLEGVTQEEEDDGYSSSIPEGTELLSFNLEEGVATVDFSSEIDPGGGSAWITSIMDQIERTLTQFDSIEEVIILVEGEEEVLQP